MDNFDKVFFPGIGGLLIGFTIGINLGALIMENDYREQAVKAECAGYNITTGEFDWFKPSDKVKKE